MKKEKIAVAFVVALSLGLAYFGIFGIRTTSVESLKKLVSQNVQVGATPEEVIRFLDSRRLGPSQLLRPEFMTMNGHDYGNQNIVVAVKRYSAEALLWKEAIYMIFVFGQDRKLVKYDVFPVYDSL